MDTLPAIPEVLQPLAVQFCLVFFRITGLMITAPLIGSDRIPRRVKILFASLVSVLTVTTLPADQFANIPAMLEGSLWLIAMGIGGEIAFGLCVGILLSMTFIAVQWAGGLAGQQMGFNLAGNFNPASDFGGSPLGDAFYILAVMVFLLMDGHHMMMLGLRGSFDALPPLSVGLNADLFDTFCNMLAAATILVVRVAAPVAVAMLVVDMSLGMVGKTIPQMNLLSVGLSVRALVGLGVVIFGLGFTGIVIANSLDEAMYVVELIWKTPADTALAEGQVIGG
ncbi:MAG: flagellar biosynthetic protein FliR [Planctomycetota bacterium]